MDMIERHNSQVLSDDSEAVLLHGDECVQEFATLPHEGLILGGRWWREGIRPHEL